MTYETKFKHDTKTSEISLLNFGEGFIAVKNDDSTIPNLSGVVIQDKNQMFIKNNNNNDDSIENDELTMLRLFYLGGISLTGLYLFYRIMSK
jgi:hypothetical protein